MMNEDLLQYIWLSGLFSQLQLSTKENQAVEIIKRGLLNTDAGPDFLNAQVKINDTIWIGNIEIHTKASEWHTHKHQFDPAYNNTILHVVLKNDKDCFRYDGSALPCIEIENRINMAVLQKYELLKNNALWVPCANFINKIDFITVSQEMDRKMIDRLQRKTETIDQWLKESNNDWQTVFYISLLRSFGFGVNSDAFELLAKNLPLAVLAKHKSNLFQLEALIFGVAGFLDKEMEDIYFQDLKKEWLFLNKKYQLAALNPSVFKYMRMRPGNFPSIRMAQFAALVHSSSHLFSKIVEEEDVNKIIGFFKSEVSNYWQQHYVFDKASKPSKKQLSVGSIQIVMINCVVPILFVYGQMMSNENLEQKALNILHQLPAESNQIVSNWAQLGVHARSAFDSQALIELKKNNCEHQKCLSCKVGAKILG